MKVLLVNGSPHEHGCTYTALKEIADQLEKNGVGSELFHIGSEPIAGCTVCGACWRDGACPHGGGVTELIAKISEADGVIIGSPVYFANIN
ncbi:MAG: flavodoxin family protein, partial [Oscillospiraceae bacterium]|nr:flavodoxin family protein [Oscillospiraceae bacterium]